MMKRMWKMAALCAALVLAALAGQAQLTVTEHVLSNGLRVWLNEDHSQPKVLGAVVVNAGAKNAPATGIAHYLEHVMFKGTDRIGTTDWAAEKIILDSITAQYDLLAATTDDAVRKRIQQTINEMSIRAAQYAIPNEYDRLISRNGGSGLNAYTSQDQTVYLNTFTPSYIDRWAQLASDRMINPVWRLFQSELETIYEEKNMYDNMMGYSSYVHLTERFFAPHPYAYDVIGTAANLKNPRLSEMNAFYEKYYVAGNMGLILSGDFNSAEVLPVLEKWFSCLPAGTVAATDFPAPKPFSGVEKFEVRLPIPIIKATGLMWRGAAAYTADEQVLDVITRMLCNSNQTGMLDKYTVDGKLMGAMAMHMSQDEASMLGVLAIPSIPFGSNSKAQAAIATEVDRIKSGDFSHELLQSVKLDLRRSHERELETIDDRAYTMMGIFTAGVTFEQYLARLDALEKLTKAQVVEVANRYFTGDYLLATKKTGKYPPETVAKPGFAPIVPPSTEAKSEYAEKMAELPRPGMKPRFVDFDKDVTITEISPLVTLYSAANPINDIFTLDVIYRRGEREDPTLRQTASYLPYLGTDSLSFDAFRGKLQDLGARLDFSSTRTSFTVSILGFEASFDQTVALAGEFLRHAKADPKQVKKVVDEEKVYRKGLKESADDIADALNEKVLYGAQSTYLSANPMATIKKFKGGEMIASLQQAMRTECDVVYCGKAAPDEVEKVVRGLVNPAAIDLKANDGQWRAPQTYDSPTVFFVDMPKATQAIVRSFVPVGAADTRRERSTNSLFNAYLGGDMSSILFQEIREFRSFAYGVSGRAVIPSWGERTKPGMMTTRM
ncbi:MAG: insulinase family protein, partial [Rikenellaceae bacterium]|nr:insulinase family protein [Rikenellaceae bacterium]